MGSTGDMGELRAFVLHREVDPATLPRNKENEHG